MALLMRPSLLLVLGLTLGLAGCLRDADPIGIDANVVAVHAVLGAGSESANVLITRPDIDLLNPPDYRPVTGAEVRLVAGTDTTWLIEDPDRACVGSPFGDARSGAGCYSGDLTFPIAERATYHLEIELADGGRITGSTRVPAAPALARPAAGSRIPLACNSAESCFGQDIAGPPFVMPVARFQVTWQASDEVQRFHVLVSPSRVVLNGDSHAGQVCLLGSRFAYPHFSTTADSIDWRIENISCGEPLVPARFDSLVADVVVTALDPGYARYLEAIAQGSSVRATSVSEGLDGAYGVFGAAARGTERITLIRELRPAPDG
jgi:hypothetical protein